MKIIRAHIMHYLQQIKRTECPGGAVNRRNCSRPRHGQIFEIASIVQRVRYYLKTSINFDHSLAGSWLAWTQISLMSSAKMHCVYVENVRRATFISTKSTYCTKWRMNSNPAVWFTREPTAHSNRRYLKYIRTVATYIKFSMQSYVNDNI